MATGKINGHEYVDLGLPSGLKWAACNVGAESPSDYVEYFSWGEIRFKSEYEVDNCNTWQVKLADISGNPNYDIARRNWGAPWRIPTLEELEELRDNCQWEWSTLKGHNGYKITGPNGKSIFIPAAGIAAGTSFESVGEICYLWSSTPLDGVPMDAYSLYFDEYAHTISKNFLDTGQSIRPVAD